MQRYNIRKGVARKSKNCLSKNKIFFYDPLPSLRPPSRNLIRIIRRRSRIKPGMRFFLFFSLSTERKNQERARCTLRVRQNHDFSHFAAGLASLKQVLAMPSAPCSIIGFYTFPSRYRNLGSLQLTQGRGTFCPSTFDYCPPHCFQRYRRERLRVGERSSGISA